MQLRLPRILADFMLGGGLAATGLAFQTSFRNPLAEPFLLGVSGGAAIGVVLYYMFIPDFIFAKQILSFGFAMSSVWFIYSISSRFRNNNLGILLLAGIGLNFFYSSMITIAHSVMSEKFSKNILLWYFGNTSNTSLEVSALALLVIIILVVILYLDAARLNIYRLGDDVAINSGINVNNLLKRVFVIGSLITAITVSLCGTIGFVGMVIPHISRFIFGSDHRINMIGSFFTGGIALVIIDTFFKTIFFPFEVPLGAITALTGTPIFIYLLMRMR